MNLSPATTGTGYETVGIPQINNSISYHVYAPKIYDDTGSCMADVLSPQS